MQLSPLSSRSFSYLLLPLLLGVAGWLWTPSSSHAQGFGVFEQGTCVMARAGATVADGCGDGSSIYFNPAHLAGTDGFTASFGATVIDVGGDFTYDPGAQRSTTIDQVDLDNDLIPVPHAYLTYGLTEKIGLGLGTYVPYGLETQWPARLSDGTVFDGAFEGFNNQLQSFYIQPTISYQITPDLSVGAGPVVAISSVELNQFQDLSQTATPGGGPTFGQLGVPFHTAFARSNLDANNEFGLGANIGVSYQVSDRVTFGARYTTPITVEYEGEATFEQVETGLTLPVPIELGGQTLPAGTPLDNVLAPQFSGDGSLTTQSVETEITFPMQLVAGVSVQATDKLMLLADYQFTGWSSFDELPLEFGQLEDRARTEDYEDTHGIRVGAEYDLLDPLTVRAGYLFNTAAVPDKSVTPLLPESDRNQFTLGFGWHVTDAVAFNVSYQRLQQNDRRGRVRGALPDEDLSTDLNQGLFSFNANLIGATFTLHL
jgi:long-chain fatty acid transport protein